MLNCCETGKNHVDDTAYECRMYVRHLQFDHAAAAGIIGKL